MNTTAQKTSTKRNCHTVAESNLWNFGQNLGVQNQQAIITQWKSAQNVLDHSFLGELNKIVEEGLIEDFFRLQVTFNLSTALNEEEVEVFLTINKRPATFDKRGATYEYLNHSHSVTEQHLLSIIEAIAKGVTAAQKNQFFQGWTITYNPKRTGLIYMTIKSPKAVSFRVIIALKEMSGSFLLLWNDKVPFLTAWSSYFSFIETVNETAFGLLDMIKIWKILIRHINCRTKIGVPLAVSEVLVWEECSLDTAKWNKATFKEIFDNILGAFRKKIQEMKISAAANPLWNLLAHHSTPQEILNALNCIPSQSELLKFLQTIRNEKGTCWWIEYDQHQMNILLPQFIPKLDLPTEQKEAAQELFNAVTKSVHPEQLKDLSLPAEFVEFDFQPSDLGTFKELDVYWVLNSKLPASYDEKSGELNCLDAKISKQDIAGLAKVYQSSLQKVLDEDKENKWTLIPSQKNTIDHFRLKSATGVVFNVIPAFQTQDNNLILVSNPDLAMYPGSEAWVTHPKWSA